MKVSLVQAVLGILIVVAFLAVTAIVALTPVLGGFPPTAYTEHLKTFASMYSGVVGLIVGFFFGRRADTPARDE